MSASMRTTLQTVPESLPADHVTNSKGEHASNMERHLQKKHEIIFLAIMEEKQKKKDEADSSRKDETLKVKMSASKIKDACIEIISVNGRPFSYLDDSGFKKLVQPLLDSLSEAERFSVSSRSIKAFITEKSWEMVNKIKNELKNKFVSIKIDGVSRLNRCFLGVNVQYVENNELRIRTLAVAEILTKHTGSAIKDIMMVTLQKFEIDLKNVYTLTSDNGSNMIKAGKLLQELQQEQESKEISEIDFLDEFEGLETFDLDLDDITVEEGAHHLTAIPCAAHVLQLACHDFFKNAGIKEHIEEVRKTVKSLRTPNNISVLKNHEFPEPILDVPTRWHSTHDMLLSLVKIKPLSHKLGFTLSSTEWRRIEELIIVLEPAKIATKKFEAEQLLMGDFMAEWMQAKYKLKKISSIFAKQLLSAIEEREQVPSVRNKEKPGLLTNPAVVAAIYLDPRYVSLLSDENKALAEETIRKLWIKKKGDTLSDPEEEPAQMDVEVEEDELEKLRKEQHRLMTSVSPATRPFCSDINSEYINYKGCVPLLPQKANVLKWWTSEGLRWPILSELSKTVLAAPATQVSVERLFSNLKFTLSKLRYNLSSKMVEDILLIRSNTLYQRKNAPEAHHSTAIDLEMDLDYSDPDLRVSVSSISSNSSSNIVSDSDAI